jgi:hypothetical protein
MDKTNEQVVLSEAPAAVGQPGKKLQQIEGGPFIYQFKIQDRAYEVLVLNGHVAPKGLDTVGRYLRAIGFLDRRQMPFQELYSLIWRFGEFPDGFDPSASQVVRGPTDGPKLEFFPDHAMLTIYTTEPTPSPAKKPGLLAPVSGGITRPKWRRALLRIDARYELQWVVERISPTSDTVWLPL